MSDDFLLALQRNFADLLSPEEQVTLALDTLITDLLHWLSGAQDQPSYGAIKQVHESLEELAPCSEKRIIEKAMTLLNSVVDQNMTAPVWQIIDYLRQTCASLKARTTPELALAA